MFLTGHTGFKGGWLCLWLRQLGAEIVGYSLPPPTSPSLFEAAKVADGMTSISGDVRNLDNLSASIARHRPEIVIHMAAQSLVRYSYQHPIETYSTNVIGTVNVLEAVRTAPGVKVMINVTTDKCYENKEWVWGYRENEAMGGHDPYSSSKGCAELVTSAYRDSYFNETDYSRHGVAVASARSGNVVGGGDWAQDRLIPDIMRAFIEGEPARIRNPQAVRPWQHVLDPLGGYLVLAENLWNRGPEYSSAWNFGPKEEEARPVSWVADHITSRWGQGTRWITEQTLSPHEARYLTLDWTKARTLLGWRPKLPLTMALDWATEWYKALHDGKNDMRRVTEAQILRYQDMQ